MTDMPTHAGATSKAAPSTILMTLLAVTVPLAVGVWLADRVNSLQDTVEDVVATDVPGVVPSELPRDVVAGETVYVSLYSHVYELEGKRLPLTGTLTVRNTDAERSLTIRSVRYYGTSGDLVRDYLEQPVKVKPLGSASYVVTQSDMSGGVGANFIVEWVSDEPVIEPVVEAVMVGRGGSGMAAFVCPGRVIKQVHGNR